MATDLYLIRHGESVPNVEPIIGGMRADAGLTARGRRQAQRLEERLRTDGLGGGEDGGENGGGDGGRSRSRTLYASTLPRALETAEYAARALRLPVVRDDELQELRPGRADGGSVEEWRSRYGGEDALRADPFRPFSPGGESWATFLVRAGAALTRLVDRHPDETVVAVCHGGVLEAAFYLAFGMGASGNRVTFLPLNASISHWQHRRGPGGRPDWTLVTFNDAGHLREGTDPAASPREAVPTPVERS